MQKKNLLNSSPYLRDPIECEALLIRSAVSSSAIEGIAASAFNVSYPARKKKIKVSKVSRRSARLPR
jgi:hypothetical protein